MTDPVLLHRPGRPALAHDIMPGKGPTILFLPGYASDMTGGKAVALAEWAAARGQAMARFDYRGCGLSEGAFEDASLADWRDDVLDIIDRRTDGPLLLVGSSMGGWLMLLAALARPERIAGLLGIAPAPDFTDWGFSAAEKATLAAHGRLERFTDYGPDPLVTTRRFWESGQAQRLMGGPIAIDRPVRLLHGQRDDAVPWRVSLDIADRLGSDDVQVTLVKDGDHRLSRPDDIGLLIGAVDSLLTRIAEMP